MRPDEFPQFIAVSFIVLIVACFTFLVVSGNFLGSRIWFAMYSVIFIWETFVDVTVTRIWFVDFNWIVLFIVILIYFINLTVC